MHNKRLVHDTAWATATYILDSMRDAIHEDDHSKAHKAFYEIIIAGIEWLDLMQAREDHHLLRKPSKN